MARPVVTLLTDYGLQDEFVGVCHGVIARLCPDARVIDLSHGIAAHDVRAGALVLARSLAFLPVGVHLAVVDPGVGGPRRAIAVTCADGRRLVGPDNGLLAPAADAAGGALAAVDIGDSPVVLRPIAATFHGRDVFAPVAAALAAGTPLDELGEAIDPGTLTALRAPTARVEGAALVVEVITVDRFGNLELGAGADGLAAVGITIGDAVAVGSVAATCARTFADVAPGELLLYEDPQRALALAVNRGSAARLLDVRAGDELTLTARR